MPNSSTSLKPLVELSLVEFMRKLAGPDATPGGGSAAALSGALAASLVTMVGGLTVGRKGFEEVTETLDVMCEQGHAITEALTLAVDRDAEAYNGVMAAFGLPKSTDEEKATRSLAIQAAMTIASEVPFEVAEECLATAELAAIALLKGNPNASSDAAVGLLLALTGLEGAVMNVATNLDALKDAAYVAEKRQELERIMQRGAELRAQMWETVRGRIKSLPA